MQRLTFWKTTASSLLVAVLSGMDSWKNFALHVASVDDVLSKPNPDFTPQENLTHTELHCSLSMQYIIGYGFFLLETGSQLQPDLALGLRSSCPGLLRAGI